VTAISVNVGSMLAKKYDEMLPEIVKNIAYNDFWYI